MIAHTRADHRRSLVAIAGHRKTVAVEEADGWHVALMDATPTLNDMALYAVTSISLEACNEYAKAHGWPGVMLEARTE